MSISRNLDGFDRVENFSRAYLGPGVYVLYQGTKADTNIVYVGKSAAEIMMRVDRHQETKDFDGVGLILPRSTTEVVIHNLEHYVLEEFKDTFGELPEYNLNNAHFRAEGRAFNWHHMARRKGDVEFLGDADRLPRRQTVRMRRRPRTVNDLRRLVDRIREREGVTTDEAWEAVADRLGGLYAASTLKQMSYTQHGNYIPPLLSDQG